MEDKDIQQEFEKLFGFRPHLEGGTAPDKVFVSFSPPAGQKFTRQQQSWLYLTLLEMKDED